MKKVLIISFSPIRSDPRVMRQIRLMEELPYEITVAGLGEKPDANVWYVEVPEIKNRTAMPRKVLWGLKLLAGAFENYYWNQYQVVAAAGLLSDFASDLIIANDLSTLPLALRLAHGRPVIYDAHEYAPREYEDRFLWRLLFGRYNHALCRKYLPQAASMLTVCQGIADEYARHFGVKPFVVHNAPANQCLEPSLVREEKIRMINHGVASSARHLEVMIEMMGYLDQRFTLDLMLIEAEPGYMDHLRKKAKNDTRIRFIEPVPMTEICRRTNEYDIGILLLPPVNFNYQHALPNKFFEFVQACLAVAIGPSPEMAALVRKYALGIVAESFAPQALANALMKLCLEDIRMFKEAAHRAAQELCFERDAQIIKAEVNRLL